MFDFEKLITPRIISALYIITLGILLIMAVISFIGGKILTAIGIIVLAVLSRIFFESIMIVFKNNEYLKRIAESLEKRP